MREQELMLSVVHNVGMNSARGHLGTQRGNRSAWLPNQRNAVRGLYSNLDSFVEETFGDLDPFAKIESVTESY